MRRIKKSTVVAGILAGAAVLFAVTLVFTWGAICESFGPFQQSESQCAICQRGRTQTWVCGTKVDDALTTTEYTDWIDTFVPSGHRHVWIGHTRYYRGRWFGRKSIACGGGDQTVLNIIRKRDLLGEAQAQRLVLQYQELMKDHNTEAGKVRLAAFTKDLGDELANLKKSSLDE